MRYASERYHVATESVAFQPAIIMKGSVAEALTDVARAHPGCRFARSIANTLKTCKQRSSWVGGYDSYICV